MDLSVLVTGVGGPLGQSIIKALGISKYQCKIVGCDMNSRSAGLYFSDKGYIVPRANAEDYISTIAKICIKERVDILFIGTIQELLPLAKNRCYLEKETGTKIIVVEEPIIELGMDKYKTVIFLKNNSLPYPRSIIAGNEKAEIQLVSDIGFPIIIKPRFASGSKNVHKVENLEELSFYKKRVSDYIIQEYLEPDSEEYTCGLFSANTTISFVIILKRELNGQGLTVRASVCQSTDIEKLCKRIASLLRLHGSINIQLRNTNKGPVVFEINPRYSSTACIRAYFGFNDVEWAIDSFLYNKQIEYKQPTNGSVIRFWEELYVADSGEALPSLPSLPAHQKHWK